MKPFTNTNHPITPPPELVQKWTSLSNEMEGSEVWMLLATFAAEWGADQELEACCQWLEENCGRWELPLSLRAGRRPKPKSQKQQALEALDALDCVSETSVAEEKIHILRRIIEEFPE